MTKDEEAIYWITATVLQEAAGEPYEGKLGVAYSIMNRAHKWGRSPISVVLQPYAYSCWNTTSPTRKLMVTRQQATWDSCAKAAEAAFHATESDPSFGSTHYLRADVLPKLPSWFRRDLVRAKLGHHEFLVPAGE